MSLPLASLQQRPFLLDAKHAGGIKVTSACSSVLCCRYAEGASHLPVSLVTSLYLWQQLRGMNVFAGSAPDT